MNKQGQNFDDADFDSLFRDSRALEGDEPVLYGQEPSSTILNPYAPPPENQYAMPPQIFSMPPWQPIFTTPPLLNTQNDTAFTEDETSPQSAFSNDFGNEEEATTTTGRPKRSRKKANSEAAQSSTASRGKSSRRKSSTAASEDGDQRRAALLERNRIAASKCRERKKAHNAELEETSRTMGAENAFLKATEAALRHELLELKYKCLEHSNCDCVAIREYMKKQALGPPAGTYPRFDSEDALRRASETSTSNAPTDATPTESMSSNPLSPKAENGKSKGDIRVENTSAHHP
jgi:hypothetical protein